MMPRVVVVSLSSDFGCQVQMTNYPELLEMLGTIELTYWQLATSGHMPTKYDVAIVEGAVTTDEQVELLRTIRETASTVILIGACAITGGIPGLARHTEMETGMATVYGADAALVAAGRRTPEPVDTYIDVEFRVPGCPIEPNELSVVLQRALLGLFDRLPREPVCASCKIAENTCFFQQGKLCVGLVTRAGCNARCVSRGRPCTGCRGVAEDANMEAAQEFIVRLGYDADALDTALGLYSSARKGSK